MYGIVYKIMNDVNGKVYVGQTIYSPEWRFDRHVSDAFGPRKLDTHFARAIRKYGAEHFSITVLEECESKDKLTEAEYRWIVELDAVKSGYNETSAKFKCGGNTYQSKTKRELRRISSKISKSNSGTNNGNATAVKCLNIKTGEELTFDTVMECSRYFGEVNHHNIGRRATKLTKSLYRGEWKIAYMGDSYDRQDRVAPKVAFKGKKRVRIRDLETGKVSEYESYAKAEVAFDLSKSTITNKMYRYKATSFIYDRRLEITAVDG